jgi:hypothetical protein
MITDKTRQLLLQLLRKAVCLQTSLWDTCSDIIDETFGGECDSLSRVMEITPMYEGKELGGQDLDAILAGMNLAAPIGEGKKMKGKENLDQDTRRKLRKAFQNAISMQSELRIATSSLAKVLDCTMEHAEEAMRSIASMADTGMELGELDLRELLGEPEAEGYIRIGRPLKPIVLN